MEINSLIKPKKLRDKILLYKNVRIPIVMILPSTTTDNPFKIIAKKCASKKYFDKFN